MVPTNMRLRVLYSFPHKLGSDRICNTAWQQVNGLSAAGVDVLVCPGALSRALPDAVVVSPTLSRGRIRIPYKLLGNMRAFALHDRIVARRLEKLVGQVDVVHTWPLGAQHTLRTAARLGIPTVLERPNAHTRYAYGIVEQECQRVDVPLPPNHEHAYNREALEKEEVEYKLATRLLCPSEFVLRTFIEQGFSPDRLARHQYGFDETVFYPGDQESTGAEFTALFVGGCAPRKGLHYALQAWLQSSAHRKGTFLIVGAFIPHYAEKLSSLLSHPSVKVLGPRKDVPELMRKSHVLLLPSIEEGSALVTYEARGSGCVLLVSEASGAVCLHEENALVHRVGDVDTLARQLTALNENRQFLERLRESSLRTVNEITWTAAGVKLMDVYRETITQHTGQFSEAECGVDKTVQV